MDKDKVFRSKFGPRPMDKDKGFRSKFGPWPVDKDKGFVKVLSQHFLILSVALGFFEHLAVRFSVLLRDRFVMCCS